MDFGHLYLKDLMSTKDTVHGLCFHFGAYCPYSMFVAALDLCNEEEMQTYAPGDKGLFIYNESRTEERIRGERMRVADEQREKYPPMHCGTPDAR